MRNHPTKLVFSLFIFLFLCISFTKMAMSQNTTISVNVGVILDYDTLLGKIGSSCINMSLSDFYASHSYYKTRLVPNARDSKRDVVGAAAAALDLIKNVEVQAIVGPQNSMQANFVIELGAKAQVPIISFSASSPSLTSIRSPYFFQATQNDSSQVNAISAIVEAFGWREVVPIYVDNEFGEGVIPYLTDALQQIDTRVPYRSVISPSATDDQIVEELYKLMAMQTRVFVVHTSPSLGSRLFANAKEIGMMSEGYVWIITDGITNFLSTMDRSVIDSMQGVLGVMPYVPRTKELENFRVRWKTKFQQDNPTIVDAELNIYGPWAYDATVALAMAVEKLGTTIFGFNTTNVSSSSTDLESFGVSQDGPNLLPALSSTKFNGLTGDYYFVNGQLHSSDFQIINVNGNGGREIGFWTPKNGLLRKLNSTNASTYPTSKANLGPIIWPGDSTSVPKGWEIPTNGKILQIGVPVKTGFSDFVKVTRDLSTNTTTVTGYCIDVFNAVMQALPYAVTSEFIPFANPDGTSAGDYNDLVYQVYLGNYDAVVGDTTIVANRSLYVDFTLPYTESGVSMVVPIIDDGEKNAWVFLKPLTWDLWVTSACFFVFIGFVVWVLEHRINEDFRGPPQHQVGTSLWFSFQTMVFAQKESVESNLARFVVIIWCFVVLILTQSYTASLTSLLTVQQLQPAVTDVNELIKTGEYVGFQQGSFVFGILKGLGFDESKLRVYNSSEGCDELFTLGSANGGIAAAFDEVPYMRLFLGQYSSKYTMVEQIFKTDGFGFVFPINSPLVPDVSRAILNVTEGDKMKEIEDAWFKKTSCPDSGSTISSNSLSLESFWGLFLIAGVASFSALIIYAAMFLYAQRQVLMHLDPKASIWRKFLVLLRIFDQRDLSSHTFKKSDMRDRSGIETSPNTNFPPSPSSYTIHTDFGEEGTPSIEHGHPTIIDQASPEIGPTIELANLDQERPITLETVHGHD